MLLVDVNHPGSQEDVVSNWEPARSLVEDATLWGRECSSPLPSGLGCHTPASLPPERGGEGPTCSQLALLWYSLNPLFCEQALEPFLGKFFLYSLSGIQVWVAVSC